MEIDFLCEEQNCEYWDACGNLLGVCPKYAKNNTTIVNYQFVAPKFTSADRHAINRLYNDYFNYLESLDSVDLHFLYRKHEVALEVLQPVFERELVKNRTAVRKLFEYTFSYSRIAIILILIKSGQFDFAKELIHIMIRQHQQYKQYYELEEHKSSYVIKEILNCARYQKIYEYKFEVPNSLIFRIVSVYYENCFDEKVATYNELECIVKKHGAENIESAFLVENNEWEYPIQELPEILNFDF